MQVCSTNEDKSKGIIVNESSTEESESECNYKKINNERDTNNEVDYEKPSVKYDPVVRETRYLKISECGKDLLNRLGATYERACMATPRYKYYTKMYQTLIDYNDRNNAPLSNEKIQKSISKVIA